MHIDELVTLVEKMPAFPNSVQRVVELASDINSSGKDIVVVIESDPVMTVKILKAINSPFYGLPRKINSIQRAVVHIGINTIKNMALSVAAIGVLKPHNKAGFDTGKFLLHSLMTAAICKKLGETMGVPQNELSDYYVAGLLHDFGKVVFAEFKAEAFKQSLQKSAEQQLPLHHCENEFIGIDHSQAGALLAEKWAFDASLVEAINHHHTPPQSSLLTQCLFVANQVSKQLGIGDAGNPIVEAFPEAVSAHFGMDLNEVIESLGDLSTLKSEALSFIH
ncbi:HDOD domain-containing protein [Methylomarinum sp. Ch1-1]|uniref:HDOD domain-containing protein n=1 Tax=Methylomarinum roseum TaxID=3067653 RepID=A0AAU7NVT1_9GAMM|nr:HDOD domain-containing protein [Methylomarinum sp. Ch1-1]MDP4522830.1 HDOD domain-containing protein [Methylomarinum sp. Ch1-1]